jgi:Ser/Thr protein kinase RdoA (MazF antagonist)
MPTLDQVRDVLPTLLSGNYPLVLTHSDLNDVNIVVDKESGHVTGVVDWANATIQPFGFTLYALDNALGSMGHCGWQYFPNADILRDEFWKAFEQLAGPTKFELSIIRVARKAGLLFRYGTPYNGGFTETVGVHGAGCDDYEYLGALLL